MSRSYSEVTGREVLISIVIVSLMIILGIVIGEKKNNYAMEENSKYFKAIHVDTTEMFEYGMKTSVGYALVYGDLKAIDTVTYPKIGGQYLSVEKDREEYIMHTRTVTDSKGKSHTETYYSWDNAGSETLQCQKVNFLGVDFNTNQLSIPEGDYIDTIYESSDVRYKYYGYPIMTTGTIFTNLTNDNISEYTPYYQDYTIDQTLKLLTSTVFIYIFWGIWCALTILIVYCFVQADNDWLY